MSAINQDFRVVSGDNRAIIVVVTDTSGAAVNIAGYTITWALARSRRGPAIITKTSSSGISITDASAGEFTVSLVPADTRGLQGLYYHEAQIADALNNITTVTTGEVLIEPQLIN